MTLDEIMQIAEVLKERPEVGLTDLRTATNVLVLAIWIRTLYPVRTAILS